MKKDSVAGLVVVAVCVLHGSPALAERPPKDAVIVRVATVAGNEDLSLQVEGGAVGVRVGDKGLSGPHVSLAGSGGEMRGHVYGVPTELRLQNGRILGSVGTEPINLRIVQTDLGIKVVGQFAGRMTNLRIDALSIEGGVGACGYTLRVDGRVYRGERSCGGAPRTAILRIPERLTRQPLVDLAVALVTLLSR